MATVPPDAPPEALPDADAGSETADGWPPFVVTLAAAAVTFETTIQAVLVAADDDRTVALRVALVLVLSMKVLFAALLVRPRPGPLLGLFLWELTSLLVAVAATDWPAGLRVGQAVTALVTLGLLVGVARRFPSPSLPMPRAA